jgi:hypothetical protein
MKCSFLEPKKEKVERALTLTEEAAKKRTLIRSLA